MFGVIIGDIAGSRFEGKHNNFKSKDFVIFHEDCRFTDDTVLSLAVCKALLESREDFSDLSNQTVYYLQKFGENYRGRGYGPGFLTWLDLTNKESYRSDKNGAAMRVSGCGYVGKDLNEVEWLAKTVTEVTHNDVNGEAVKGAQAVAGAIFLAREGKDMKEIRNYINDRYYPMDQHPMDQTLGEIRPRSQFDYTCKVSVQRALLSFFEARDFEDAIRNAVSLGGDSDTNAAIAGSIAEAYFGIPEWMREKAEKFLNVHMLMLIERFEDKYQIK